MARFNYLIIGGGIAGTTATEVIRQKDSEGSIAIISDEPYRLYSRILLSKPNFFLEKIPFEQIWLKTESWYEEKKISLLAGKKAVALNSEAKEIELDDGQKISYNKLLLALGGCARKWGVPGADKNGVFYLRTLDDARAIITAVKTAREAILIGGGFVSFEMCEMLRLAGIEVTLVLRESYYWEPLLDEPSGRIIEQTLEKGGVKILRNAEVEEVAGEKSVEGIILKNGSKISCGMIIAGIGVTCPFDQIKLNGVSTNRGILANEYLETTVSDVWTAGDCAEFQDLILDEKIQLGNWVNAQMQGRIAGLNMAGERTPFKMVSFYTTTGFGITIAFVGDVRPISGRAIVARGTPDSGAYGRIIVKEGRIIGATLINRTAELGIISKIIEKNINVSGRESELGDSSFDLRALL